MIKTVLLLFLILATIAGCQDKDSSGQVANYDDAWFASGREEVQLRQALLTNPVQAKNVILFVGDGMGISTLTATRIYAGQMRGDPGEENSLSFERFPHVALIKTYNANQQVADSAGSGSAMQTGVKTRAGVLGVSEIVQRRNCAQGLEHEVATIAEIASSQGLAIGVVSNMRITDATPASVYAHSATRDWERDSTLARQAEKEGCRDIARQLTGFAGGDGLDVVLGGGRNNFVGSAAGGKRLDPNSDLIGQWLDAAPGRVYVDTAGDLESLAVHDSRQLLGLFSDEHMKFMLDRGIDDSEPTLSEMTASAIDVLAKNPGGFYLAVEGGLIDKGHHRGIAEYALSETLELSRAVQVAVDKVNLRETLILVTADHSGVLTIGGYPSRGNPIFGLVVKNDRYGEPQPSAALAADGKPYTTLGYQNGPGAVVGSRANPGTWRLAVQQSAVPTIDDPGDIDALETHAGEDVALFATGPGAQLVGGVLEQHSIFHIIVASFGWKYSDE